MQGNIRKMATELAETVNYKLPIGNDFLDMNSLIGKTIKLTYLHQINCIHCGKKTKISFAQGYCYNCYKTLPETDVNIVNPELDLSYLGISRDMEWSKKHSLQPHYVYLAFSGNLKVGVTRESQIPTRWIDQGAIQAIKLAKTPNRHIAGIIEVALKNYFSDKTNWRNMLKNSKNLTVGLLSEKKKAIDLLHGELKQYRCDDDTVYTINYPLEGVVDKVNSFNFDKVETFTGTLTGIKGQYLIFDKKEVINIRRHSGYLIQIEEIN